MMPASENPETANNTIGRKHAFDIIDAHHHVGSVSNLVGDNAAATESDEVAQEHDIASRLDILDQQGIRQAVVIAGHGYLRPNGLADTQQINDGIARYRDQRLDRFPVAVGIVEPLYGKAGIAELVRCRDELGLIGISFHTRYQGVPLDSPWIRRYLEQMGQIGLIPFIHSMGLSPEESLWQVDALARDFPDMTMIVMDVFADTEQPFHLVYVAERNPNLLFDTSLALSVEMLLEPTIKTVGSDRFVFGTDTYSWPLVSRPTHLLDQLLAADLEVEGKADILGGTLRRALSI